MSTTSYMDDLIAERDRLAVDAGRLEGEVAELRQRAAVHLAEFHRLTEAANRPDSAGVENEAQAALLGRANSIDATIAPRLRRIEEIDRLLAAPERARVAAGRVQEVEGRRRDAEQRAARIDEVLAEIDADAQREREAAELTAQAEADALIRGEAVKVAKPKSINDAGGARREALEQRRREVRVEVEAIDAELADALTSLAGAREDVARIGCEAASIGAARLLAVAEVEAERVGLRAARSSVRVEIPSDVLAAAREAAHRGAPEGAVRA